MAERSLRCAFLFPLQNCNDPERILKAFRFIFVYRITEVDMKENTYSLRVARPALKAILCLAMILSAAALMAETQGTVKPDMLFAEQYQNMIRYIAQKALPVVVEVNVVDVIKQPVQRFFSPFDFFFNFPNDPQNNQKNRNTPEEQEFRRNGLGSGVIVRKVNDTVYVLTNNHVVGNADEISVNLYDGRQFTAKLVGKDPLRDLALVSFETKEDVPIADLGDSNKLQVGDIVLAVGNPYGFESTVTYGIVSALGRRVSPDPSTASLTDYIQTDAAINQGNSGGALVNIQGEVIGINTWIASSTGGNVGLGFAIPINNAKKTIDDFILKGKVDYGWLGINTGDATDSLRDDMKLKGKSGSFVYDIFKGSPADRSGIQPGDFITAINGKDIKDRDDLVNTVAGLTPGQAHDFSIVRLGKEMNIKVTIDVRDADSESLKSQKAWPGMVVVGITDQIRKNLNLPKKGGNIVVGSVEQNSPAAIGGIRPGDIIKEINGKSIDTVMDFYKALSDSKSEVMMKIVRQNNEFVLGLVK